ncbi:MAG: universal stress protein [Pseudomonadota bacterium]
MKSLLVPVDDSDAMAPVFDLALAFAKRFNSQIDGVALRPVFTEIVAPDPIVAVPIPPADWNESAFLQATRQRFEAYFDAKGVRRAPANPKGLSDAPQSYWHHGTMADDGFIGAQARVYDAVVLGRPVAGGASPRMNTLESVLFDSGRPILMAPPQAPASLGEHVLIAWNKSTETARAAAVALPLLAAAQKVTVLTVENETVTGPPASALVRYLALQGIEAEEVHRTQGGRKPGATILATAHERGCDLIVKGAYTTSRLRQMIFGGPTSHLLAAADIPVFLDD